MEELTYLEDLDDSDLRNNGDVADTLKLFTPVTENEQANNAEPSTSSPTNNVNKKQKTHVKYSYNSK